MDYNALQCSVCGRLLNIFRDKLEPDNHINAYKIHCPQCNSWNYCIDQTEEEV